MKSKIAVALFAALLACTIAACAALADTVTLAFGYELEAPEGVEITKEMWDPENELVYWLEGSYKEGQEHFLMKLFHGSADALEANEAWMERDRKVFTRFQYGDLDFSGEYYVGYSITGIAPDDDKAYQTAREFACQLMDAGVFEAAAPSQQPAEEEQPENGASASLTATVVTKSSPLSLRETPGNRGDVILEIPKGETVTVLKQGDWSLVKYGGKMGYVNGKYLEMNP